MRNPQRCDGKRSLNVKLLHEMISHMHSSLLHARVIITRIIWLSLVFSLARAAFLSSELSLPWPYSSSPVPSVELIVSEADSGRSKPRSRWLFVLSGLVRGELADEAVLGEGRGS